MFQKNTLFQGNRNTTVKKERKAVARSRKGLAGFSLPTVLGLSALLAVGLSVVFVSVASSTRVTGKMIKRRKMFYICDGLSRTLVRMSQDYFLSTATPSAAGLTAHLSSIGGGSSLSLLTPSGFTTSFSVNTDANTQTGLIPNGPFKDMNAQLNELSLNINSVGPSGETCNVNENLTIGLIGLFQFFGFTDGPNEIINAAPITVNGRIHANGDFCAESTSTRLSKITASGIFRHGSNCVHSPGGGGSPVTIINTPGGTTTVGGAQDGTSAGWRLFAINTLGKNVQDITHGVNNLRIPFNVSPQMQDGRNMDGVVLSNANSFRFFIDPVLPSDNAQIREEKLSYQADIRIINGVWYENDGSWPGKMIYSDHRVSYNATNLENIEGNLTNATQAALGVVGRRYSYYDPSNTSGVISYGTLIRQASVTATKMADWVPGCVNGGVLADASGTTCAPTSMRSKLVGTRAGFVDHRIDKPGVSSTVDVGLGRILPINFDVRQFTNALQDLNIGELGSIFPSTSPFNGIVWITQTWPGQMNGLGGGVAQKWPAQGGLGPTQGVLPFPLCGAGTLAPAFALGGGVTLPAITAPNCTATGIPNALRVHNADVIHPTVFPDGLTIATNLPGYLLGNTNTGSFVSPANWRPFLFAADSVSLLSNAWDDGAVLWGDTNGYGARVATDTRYVVAMFTGVVNPTPGTSNGGFINFPRFLETWSGVPGRINGSLVSGFTSVFQDHTWSLLDYYRPPNRLWTFDTNLSFVRNQPPGTPTFMVSAIRSWERN